MMRKVKVQKNSKLTLLVAGLILALCIQCISVVAVNAADPFPNGEFKVETTFIPSTLVPNQMMTAKVTATDISQTPYDGKIDVLVIVGLYDKQNTMVNVSYISKGIPYKGTEILTAGFKLPANIEGHKVKAFMWDGTDMASSNMIPMSNVVQIPNDNPPAPTPTNKATPTSTPTPTKAITATSTITPKVTVTPTVTPTSIPTQIILPTPVQGLGTYYVAPDGDDTNPGTKDKPFKSLHMAAALARPGNTIYMRGGTYNYNTMVSLTQSGTESAGINILAYPGEKPVLNYSAQAYASANRGINLLGNYWYIKGLEICYAGDNGIKLEGSYNRIENCVFHHNGDGGLQMGFGHTTANPGGTLCAYNEIINCDSYLNFDFDNAGSDADGFACKMHNGKGNKFIGCRAWRNGDDGWDLFETDWPVEITNCWTWHNADKADFDAIYQQKMGKPMSSFQGNGNGFKLGGNGTGGSSKGTHVVKNCISFDNYFKSRKGFDQNSHKGGVTIYNCVSFGNGYNYMFEDSAESGAANEFKNNVSFACRGSLDHEFSSGSIEQNNSWNLTVTASADDFTSLSEELAKAPRNPDGSLPNNAFAKLVQSSDLIDKGMNIGTPYLGSAPDLGAFECK